MSQNARALVLPAEVTGLTIALAATDGFFVVKRQSWLLAAPLSFGLSFSFALALIEGWNTHINMALLAARIALVIGAVGLARATFVIVGRGVARELGEQIAHEGLFRDDGEQIIVYAQRGRVVLRALTSSVILALVMVVGGLWAHTVVADVFWQIAIVI